MKHRIIWTIALSLASALPCPAENIPATDSRITVIGRTATEGTEVSFDWTGTYARIRFRGTDLTLKAGDTKKSYYNVWLDSDMKGDADKIIEISCADTTICLFSAAELKARFGKNRKAAAAPHQVVLQKRTEGAYGRTTLKEFSVDGEFLQADAPKDRIIEFVGDSYTCGFGTENSIRTDPFKLETENQNKTYACIVSRYFDADHIAVAHSGWGVARNYNGKVGTPCMPEKYLQTFDEDPDLKWNPAESGLKPCLTVIYLGTNDFSRGLQPARKHFVKSYRKLLNEIKTWYGEKHPVLCIAPKNDLLMFDYIREAVGDCGLEGVHIMALTTDIHNGSDEMGASGHPNYKGHVKKAYSIIPYISTIMGWDLGNNDIR